MLRQILLKITENKAQGRKSLAVFDLDSTLFDVGPRLERILVDFAAEATHRKKFPKQVEILKNMKIQRKDWGVWDALARAGLHDEHPEFQHALKDYWRATFFSDAYLDHDIPYPGAVGFVAELFQAGAEIAYLTGRDIARMGKGSVETLEKWKFPLGSKAELILKPHLSMNDAEFKTNWFKALPANRYASVWFFENEPVNIHHLRANAEGLKTPVEIVFFDSTHSRIAEPPTDLLCIEHFLYGDEK